MEIGLSNTLLAGDTRLIDHIVGEVKSQGIFDQFRKECIADVDTKPAYQNLRTRVEGSVNSFLNKQVWKPDLNKNQLRETLRKHIHDAPYLDAGVERIVDQVVNPKVYSVFMSQIEDVVYKFLGVERPKAKEKNDACGLKDLLPKDLDPVSPESDKNSLKDVSLESVDANDNLNEKQQECNEQKLQNEEVFGDKNKKSSSENGHISLEQKVSDEIYRALNKTGSSSNLNITGKSDDKLEEEEEEVSPTFEPIDIMNLNECNISNDSHLSGISELTSHRSRSPDFSNELSRDNFDCENQDSQLSKVSSDSRLSIVTDFGSSNHGLTPIHDTSRDETIKDKCEAKSSKDNFKAIGEFDSSKNKTTKSNFDFAKSKDTQDYKDSKDFKSTKSMSSKESSRDTIDSGMKDKYEHKSSKEKNKDIESIKSSKSTKEKTSSKDEKYYKDKSNERKKFSSHSSTKYDKHSKSKSKDKIEIKENSDKAKDVSENLKDNVNKFKDEKLKEADKKDNINKEARDLKDLYKEKIRELREKKELTEKEKLNKDKDIKVTKETKDRKDSPKDRKSSRKEHRSSSSSSSSRNLSVNHHESKSSKASERTVDGKDKRSDSSKTDKAKRDERRSLKDSKSKSYYSSKSDISDRSDKSDTKKAKSEKEDKIGKMDAKKDVKTSSEKTTNGKKDAKSHMQRSKSTERNEKLDNRKDSKNDSPSKDKRRREDKKSKMKDDHSSLRKNSNNRRSTDRDGSNGSNSKTSPSNNSSSNATSNKSGTSNLTKENHVSNPSETSSDSIEEMQVSDMKSHQSNCKLSHKISSQLSKDGKYHSKMETDNIDEMYNKQEKQIDSCDLHLKKRSSEDDESTSSDMKIKKPKFARNIHEAKKLMKIRKQMEKQKLKEDKKEEKKIVQETEQTDQSSVTKAADNLESMPDYERVQIIEVRDEEYEEPYPEKHEPNLTLDERSIIMLGAESCTTDILEKHSNLKPTLSSMELCIKQSLSEIVSNAPLEKMVAQDSKIDEKITKSQSGGDSFQQSSTSSYATSSTSHTEKDMQASKKLCKDELKNVDTEQRYIKTHISQKQKEAISEKSMDHDEKKSMRQLAEKNAETRNYNRAKTQDDNKETQNNNRSAKQDNNEESQNKKRIEMTSSRIDAADSSCNRVRSSSPISEDNEDCRYFKTDNEKSEKFSNFLESLELVENSSLEDIIESLGGKVVSSLPRSMAAPPLPRRKRSSSPLSDILVNNSDNNNDGPKQTLSSSPNEDTVHNIKKRKFVKKSRLSSLCNPQGISNGENFVMPLSPDSDVSATSDKTASSNVIKEEKSRNRSSQRYSSDDLYKPRPLFSSSSRRSRRSNQS